MCNESEKLIIKQLTRFIKYSHDHKQTMSIDYNSSKLIIPLGISSLFSCELYDNKHTNFLIKLLKHCKQITAIYASDTLYELVVVNWNNRLFWKRIYTLNYYKPNTLKELNSWKRYMSSDVSFFDLSLDSVKNILSFLDLLDAFHLIRTCSEYFNMYPEINND